VRIEIASTEAQAWRKPFALIGSERILTDNVIVGAGTMAAGSLGVVFQSLFSHHLKPADYGGLFAIVTLISFIGLPASAFTLLMAREASRDRANGLYAASAALLRRGNRALLFVGLALAAVLGLSAPLLAGFLQVPAILLLAAAVGIPFGFALPLLLGELQGEQRFVAFSVLLVGQAALKLIAAVALSGPLGPLGIVAGISIATAAVYLGALVMLRRKLSIKPRWPWWRPAISYLAVIVPSTLALAVLLSADVLLVKHYFPSRAAGEYAAVAALGRAIFWGASGVAAVLFPKFVFRVTNGENNFPLVGGSLLIVALGGLAGLGLLWATSNWLLTTFAGTNYSGAASYLPWYAMGMTFLGGVAVLVATQQASGKPDFLAVLLPLTFVEPALIAAFHKSLTQVVQLMDLSMAVTFGCLAAFYLYKARANNRWTGVPQANVHARSTANLRVNR
jgi:O-antigen/teichoic acid export membrane protein